jgi:hypothetical protein
MRLKTLNDFQDHIDRDFGWRVREIAAIKAAANSASGLAQDVAIRAGIPLLYAHWEGYVKFAAETYVRYVGAQRLPYSALADEFIVFGAKGHLHHLGEAKKAAVNVAAVGFFTRHLADTASLSWKNAINTESNLSSTVYANILLSIGLNFKPYEARSNLIDISLLKRRNSIAHGEQLDLEAKSFGDLVTEVLDILNQFKADLEDAATEARFKRVLTV